MAIKRSAVRFIFGAVGIGLCCVAFLAPVASNSTDQASTGPPNASLAQSPQPDGDLRLIAETVGSLRQIHTDSSEANIPAAARPFLTALKHQLRDLIANRLRFEKRRVNTQQLQARAIVDLSNLSLIDDEEGCVVIDANYVDRGYDYGHIESITVTRPHYDFDVIAVTTTIGICCGEDTSLYLFKYEDEEWRLWLADEKNDYDRIDKAQGLFEFGLSWPGENKDYFVVTADVNPWCTSNWQSIRYRVLRPGSEPYEPRVLLSRDQTIYLGAEDPPYRLEVADRSFSLRFYGDKYSDSFGSDESDDSDEEGTKELVRYRVEGDAVIAQK